MPAQNIEFFSPFAKSEKQRHIPITVIKQDTFDDWLSAQDKTIKQRAEDQGFNGKAGQTFPIYSTNGETEAIVAGSENEITYTDGSKIKNAVSSSFSKDSLKDITFSIEGTLHETESNALHIGWALACYKFSFYKKEDEGSTPNPALILPPKSNKERINAFVESICLIRDLVNIPANDMGPDELQSAAEILTKEHKCALNVIADEELIEQNFPMIYDVGRASTRRPRLIDFTWGDENNPKITLVGKGVCFDTGGLDIKPSQFMLTMKKDMGGSAHVLGLAHLIMRLNLPIRLRVLIPAVENAISGNAYRPSDILNSRKGITVEVGNTDAEGRLVLADALTYACEEDPELLIDFATLTGAARIALGYDVPALFSNNDETAHHVQVNSATTEINDPVWQLPLWQPYRKDLDCPSADISSTGVGRAGATNAALFLQEFINNDIEWIHMDVYAWEQTGKPGRPKGGADTGMRAIFALLEERYNSK